MQRSDRIALLVGACLCAGYLLVAALGTLWHQSPRPLYDGPCPPTVCTPCPGFQCSYTTSTQTPPPSSTSTHSTTQTTTQTTQTTTQPSTTHASSSTSTSAASSTAPGSSTSSGTSPPGSSSGSSSAPSSSTSTAAGSSSAVAVPPGTPAMGVIGPGGGTLASPDGELAVAVPPGALTTPATMEVLAADAITPAPPPGRSAVGHAWDLDGSGSAGPVTVFATPITVTLHYTGTDPEFLFYWDGSAWNALQTSVDTGAKTATATVPHLTVFAAFTPAAGTSSGGGSGTTVAIVLVLVLIGVIAVIAVVSRRRGQEAR